MSKSKIIGRATAIFGGQIQLEVGYTDTKYAIIGMSELKEEHTVGQKVKGGNFGEQIILAFDSIDSINVFRDALDIAEYAIKTDGKMPEQINGFEEVKDGNDGES